MEAATRETFRLDGRRIVVDLDARRLRVAGATVKLGGRAFDVLAVLVQRRDRGVPKRELLDLVWPGLVVEENTLQVHVASLRRALGAGAIATVSGRGYRCTMPADRGAQCDAAPGGGHEALLIEVAALLNTAGGPQQVRAALASALAAAAARPGGQRLRRAARSPPSPTA